MYARTAIREHLRRHVLRRTATRVRAAPRREHMHGVSRQHPVIGSPMHSSRVQCNAAQPVVHMFTGDACVLDLFRPTAEGLALVKGFGF